MPVCSFCKKNYSEHKGVTVFAFDGKAHHFCSSKCRRNLDLKRDPKKVNWVKRDKKVKQEVVESKPEVIEEKPKVEEKKEEKVVEKEEKAEVSKKEVKKE